MNGISTLAWQRGIAWNWPDLAWKIMEKLTFYGIVKIFYYLRKEFTFLSAEFPFVAHGISISERWILGDVFFRAPLSLLSAKFAFSECRISIFSVEFAISDRRILGSLFRAVIQCKICIFWAQNFWFFTAEFMFSEHWISLFWVRNTGGYLSKKAKSICPEILATLERLPKLVRGRSKYTDVIAAKIYGHISEGGLCWDWLLPEEPM